MSSQYFMNIADAEMTQTLSSEAHDPNLTGNMKKECAVK